MTEVRTGKQASLRMFKVSQASDEKELTHQKKLAYIKPGGQRKKKRIHLMLPKEAPEERKALSLEDVAKIGNVDIKTD